MIFFGGSSFLFDVWKLPGGKGNYSSAISLISNRYHCDTRDQFVFVSIIDFWYLRSAFQSWGQRGVVRTPADIWLQVIRQSRSYQYLWHESFHTTTFLQLFDFFFLCTKQRHSIETCFSDKIVEHGMKLQNWKTQRFSWSPQYRTAITGNNVS